MSNVDRAGFQRAMAIVLNNPQINRPSDYWSTIRIYLNQHISIPSPIASASEIGYSPVYGAVRSLNMLLSLAVLGVAAYVSRDVVIPKVHIAPAPKNYARDLKFPDLRVPIIVYGNARSLGAAAGAPVPTEAPKVTSEGLKSAIGCPRVDPKNPNVLQFIPIGQNWNLDYFGRTYSYPVMAAVELTRDIPAAHKIFKQGDVLCVVRSDTDPNTYYPVEFLVGGKPEINTVIRFQKRADDKFILSDRPINPTAQYVIWLFDLKTNKITYELHGGSPDAHARREIGVVFSNSVIVEATKAPVVSASTTPGRAVLGTDGKLTTPSPAPLPTAVPTPKPPSGVSDTSSQSEFPVGEVVLGSGGIAAMISVAFGFRKLKRELKATQSNLDRVAGEGKKTAAELEKTQSMLLTQQKKVDRVLTQIDDNTSNIESIRKGIKMIKFFIGAAVQSASDANSSAAQSAAAAQQAMKALESKHLDDAELLIGLREVYKQLTDKNDS